MIHSVTHADGSRTVTDLPDDGSPGTVTTYGPKGKVVEVVEVPGQAAPAPAPEDNARQALVTIAQRIPPEQMGRAVLVGAALVARAGDLWDALTAIPDHDDARPSIEIVTDVALTAALAALDTPPTP